MNRNTPYTRVRCECGEPVPLTLNYEHQGRRLCSADCHDNATRREAQRGEYQTDNGPSTHRLRIGLFELVKTWLECEWNPNGGLDHRVPSLLAAGKIRNGDSTRPMDNYRSMVDEIRDANRATILQWAAEASA